MTVQPDRAASTQPRPYYRCMFTATTFWYVCWFESVL